MTIKNFEQIAAFGKANVDALVESCTVAAKGSKTLINAYVALARQSVSLAESTVKALSTVKSPTEFRDVVTGLTKSNLETAQLEGRKLQELVTVVVTDSLAPLGARVKAASSLMKAA